MMEAPRATLSFRRIPSLAIVSLLVIAFLGLSLELSARAAFARNPLPIFPIGVNHLHLELQLARFFDYVQAEGVPECIIMGNSTIAEAVDPPRLAAAFENTTGESLECFNFAVNNLNLSVGAALAQILEQSYEIPLIVYGISWTEMRPGYGQEIESTILNNPWIRYRLGDFNVEGWLIEHSYAFRALLLVGYTRENNLDYRPYFTSIRTMDYFTTRAGFRHNQNVNMDLFSPSQRQDKLQTLNSTNNLSVYRQGINAVTPFASLPNSPRIVFVEYPVHPSITYDFSWGEFRNYEDEYADYINGTVELAADVITQNGMVYIPYPDSDLIPLNGWSDRFHMNFYGAAPYSRWLGEQIGLLVLNGQLALPDH